LKILVDTNVLLRFVNPSEANHERIVSALNKHLTIGNQLGHTPQNRRELWNVATRPMAMNGLGTTPEQALRMLVSVSEFIELWDDVPGIHNLWMHFVRSQNVRGVQVHDANLAAAAVIHGATHIMTLNERDFSRYSAFGLVTLSPFS
jgi:predicted nucleic acid-binding protein